MSILIKVWGCFPANVVLRIIFFLFLRWKLFYRSFLIPRSFFLLFFLRLIIFLLRLRLLLRLFWLLFILIRIVLNHLLLLFRFITFLKLYVFIYFYSLSYLQFYTVFSQLTLTFSHHKVHWYTSWRNPFNFHRYELLLQNSLYQHFYNQSTYVVFFFRLQHTCVFFFHFKI